MTDFAASSTGKKASGPLDRKSSILPELSSSSGVPSWSHFLPIDHTEVNEKWMGRQRIETVQGMLNHWQVAAIRQAIRLPVATYVIELDAGTIDPVAASLLATDLDVQIQGTDAQPRLGLTSDLFSSRRHFDRAMDALDYGHAVFEQAGRYDAAGYWRLTDLAPVPQWTIVDGWEVDANGRLLGVKQWMHNPPVTLPVDHLVTFTWQGAPGDPRGRSMLRPLFFPQTLSDRLVRVMAMSGERTGMGIPVGKVAPGSGLQVKQKMEGLLAGLAAGHDTNLVIETDEHIEKAVMLMGVTGTTPDIVGMLRYLDDIMARAMLAQLMNLSQGTGTGSFALGQTFDDLLSDFHDAVVQWYCDTMNHQIVEPWLSRNRTEDQLATVVVPRLVWKRREIAAPVTAAPAAQPALPAPAADAPAPVAARRRGTSHAHRARAARASFAATVGRDLRRDPFEHELAAATDFAAIEQQHVAATDDLAAVLERDRDDLAAAAVELVQGMVTVDPLTLGAALGPLLAAHAAAMDSGPLVTLLSAAAQQGVSQVVGEAARQGVTLTATVDYAARAEAEARELLRRMAAQVTETAAAAARTAVPSPVQASRGRSLLPGRFGIAKTIAAVAGFIAAQFALLAPTAPREAAAGATSRATNGGRFAAIAAAPTNAIYSSELLDSATCGPCEEVDGTEYASVEDAMRDYPAGGYFGCEGWERCRGTLVATFSDEQAALA